MKILFFLSLLAFTLSSKQASAAFVTAHNSMGQPVAIDSPQVHQRLNGYGHRMKTPTKQVRGMAVLSLLAGLLSITGAITFLVLWPVSVGVGVALAIGTLATGVAAMTCGEMDSMNIKSYPGLSITGFFLGFIAAFPVLFPLSILGGILGGIYFGIITLFKRRRKRRRLRTSIVQ